MNEKQLNRLIGSGKFICGVHNYCDRWCERCPLASRCSVRAIELEDRQTEPGARADITNAAFWKHLSETFAVTRRMIERDCKDRGIVITPEDLEKAGRKERRRDVKVRRSALAKNSMAYADLVEKWFEDRPELFDEKQRALESIAAMELPGHDPAADAIQIADAIEVIQWYRFFIGAKTHRAVDGLVECEEEGPMEGDDYRQSDANGSAKIALIAIDRSQASWSRLRRHFAEEGDRVLDLLVHLDRLRRDLEKTFPEAHEFKRPGFDDPKIMAEADGRAKKG